MAATDKFRNPVKQTSVRPAQLHVKLIFLKIKQKIMPKLITQIILIKEKKNMKLIKNFYKQKEDTDIG